MIDTTLFEIGNDQVPHQVAEVLSILSLMPDTYGIRTGNAVHVVGELLTNGLTLDQVDAVFRIFASYHLFPDED